MKGAGIMKRMLLVVLAIVAAAGLAGCGKASVSSTARSKAADPTASGKLVGICAVFSDEPTNMIVPQSVFDHDAYALVYSARTEDGLPVLSYWGNPVFKPKVTYVGKSVEWDTPHANTSYKVSASLPGPKKYFRLHAIYQLKDGSFYVDPETDDTSSIRTTDAKGNDLGPATMSMSKKDPRGGPGTFTFEITINPQPDDSTS